MLVQRRIAMMFAVTATAMTPAALAEDERDALIDALRSEVAQLRDSVAELKAADDDNWLTERRAEEIRGVVEDVLADADTRASLLQNGATAGWDKNFYLQSADGNWRMRLRGQLQLRWVWNHADDQNLAPVPGPDDLYGFEVRRAKIKFDGHVFDPTWKYVLNLAWDHDDGGGQGDVDVEDAIIKKDFENGAVLWMGQYKLPFLREENISSSAQLAVDRSLVNETFNQDRSQGLMIQYSTDTLRFWGAFTDGFASKNTSFASAGNDNAFTGRVDWLAAGDWKQFKDFQGWKGQAYGAMVGGAVHYQKSKYGAPYNAAGRLDRLTWTLDAQVEGDGWNVFAYVVGNHLSPQGGVSMDQLGIVVQGGYMFSESCDGFLRYEWADLDTVGDSDISVITAGVNYYLHKNGAKWTTDIGFGLDGVPASHLGVGWREDAPSQDGQVVLRSQFQLLF